jgi:DNA-binding response OmpR family regulator
MVDRMKNVILLVGVKPGVSFYLRKVLLPVYEVVEAPVGAERFIKLVQKLLPDVVICYISTRDTDGTEVCRALRNDQTNGYIPLILILSKGSDEFIIKGFENGADDCIVWPFNVNILKARIKNLVDNRRQFLDKIRLWAMLQPVQPDVTHIDSTFVEQLRRIIQENLSNPLFSVERLCHKLYMSRASMYRKIRLLTGESPQLFIRSYRLKRATQLLEKNYGNVTEICFRVGFTSTAYFSKCCKEKFHHSPKIFARVNGNGSSKFSTFPQGHRKIGKQ